MLTKRDIKFIKNIDNIDGEDVYHITRPKGLGDSIENFLHTGIVGNIVHAVTGKSEPCEPCKQRRDFINKIIPYE